MTDLTAFGICQLWTIQNNQDGLGKDFVMAATCSWGSLPELVHPYVLVRNSLYYTTWTISVASAILAVN